MANRDRQRIRCVCARDLGAGEEDFEHGLNLRFLRAAGADNGFFDEPRGIFGHGQPTACGGEQADTARLTEFERRLWVGVDEDFLDRGGFGSVAGDDIGQAGVEDDEAFGQGCFRVGRNLAIGDMAEAVADGGDNAPAGCAEAGIDAEDDQPSRSKMSSATS